MHRCTSFITTPPLNYIICPVDAAFLEYMNKETVGHFVKSVAMKQCIIYAFQRLIM